MSSSMPYTRLGKSGLRVSRLCLGTMTYGSSTWRDWVLDEKAARPFFERALEAGINFFDTADVYSLGVSEEIVGRAIKDLVAGSGLNFADRGRHTLKGVPGDWQLFRVE